MAAFEIDAGIARSAAKIFDLPLSTVLLKEDARWPWLILVPRRPGLEHLIDLTDDDSGLLMREVRIAARAVAAEAGVERINVGALGNVVAQLHVHVVGRWAGDAAWPGPVWSVEGKQAYDFAIKQVLVDRLTERLERG